MIRWRNVSLLMVTPWWWPSRVSESRFNSRRYNGQVPCRQCSPWVVEIWIQEDGCGEEEFTVSLSSMDIDLRHPFQRRIIRLTEPTLRVNYSLHNRESVILIDLWHDQGDQRGINWGGGNSIHPFFLSIPILKLISWITLRRGPRIEGVKSWRRFYIY